MQRLVDYWFIMPISQKQKTKDWRSSVAIAGALFKGWAAGFIGFAAVWTIVFMGSIAADNNVFMMVIILTSAVTTILALAIALNVLKKKL